MKTLNFRPMPYKEIEANLQLFLIWRTGGQWCAFTHCPKRALDVITELSIGLDQLTIPNGARNLNPSSFILPRSMLLMGQILECFIKSNDLPSPLTLLIALTI